MVPGAGDGTGSRSSAAGAQRAPGHGHPPSSGRPPIEVLAIGDSLTHGYLVGRGYDESRHSYAAHLQVGQPRVRCAEGGGMAGGTRRMLMVAGCLACTFDGQ